MKPQNLEEAVIFYAIVGIYVWFFLSAQFIVVPVIAWGLLAYLLLKHFFLKSYFQPAETTPVRIPLGVWVWIVTMAVVFVALIVGLFNLDAGLTRLIKSTVNNFMRTWALLAIFPLLGCFHIRPQIISRAVCLLAAQSLLVLPVAFALISINADMPLYSIGIMEKIGGFSDLYYEVGLFVRETVSGNYRLTMYAPWGPALAFTATVHIWLAYFERNAFLRWMAIAVNVILVIGSASRLGALCLVALPIARIGLTNLSKPLWLGAAAAVTFIASLQSSRIITALTDLRLYFDNQRSESSHVREVLARVALHRWQEAPIWGHALKAPGSEATRDMPIGSHHTWFGVLFTHGIVGLTALLFAIAYTFVDLVAKAQGSRIAQTALMVLLSMLAFSFGENLETLAYMYWPGLMFIGMGFQEKLYFPEHRTA